MWTSSSNSRAHIVIEVPFVEVVATAATDVREHWRLKDDVRWSFQSLRATMICFMLLARAVRYLAKRSFWSPSHITTLRSFACCTPSAKYVPVTITLIRLSFIRFGIILEPGKILLTQYTTESSSWPPPSQFLQYVIVKEGETDTDTFSSFAFSNSWVLFEKRTSRSVLRNVSTFRMKATAGATIRDATMYATNSVKAVLFLILLFLKNAVFFILSHFSR